MPELRRQAARVRGAGRGGDTELVHMTPREIMAMEAWLGRKMPRNPRTGLREAELAGSLFSGGTDTTGSQSSFIQSHPWLQPSAPVTPPQFLNLGRDYSGSGKSFDMPLMAINPRTGQPERVSVDYGTGTGPFDSDVKGYYFPSDNGQIPSTASPGLAGGFSSAGPMSWDEMAVIGGLGAIGGAALGGAFAAPGADTAAGGASAVEGGGAAAGAGGIPADFAGDAAAGAAMQTNAASTGVSLGDPSAGTGLWSGNTFSGGEVVPFGGPGDMSSMAFGPQVSNFVGDIPTDPQLAGSAWDQTPNETGGGGGTGGDQSYWQRFKGLPWKGAAQGLNLASGAYGLYNAAQMRRMAQQAQDPHLREYQDRLNALTRDPSSVTSMPGYQFGLDEGRRAIQRQGAATGSGGNEAIALARYTPAYAQQFYENQVRDLSSMSRGDSTALQGNALAMQLANQALWQLGYGLNRLGG